MSTVNRHYTFFYSQPSEYRFSQDSVILARQVFELLGKDQIENMRGLDLCAGCGIIGMDFLFHCRKEYQVVPGSFDFLEVQDVYLPHFEKNVQGLGEISTQIQFVNQNYNVLLNEEYRGRYDLILSNPPYFFPGKGTLSPSEFKNRCRFFMDSDLPNLLLGIANSLSPSGKAFVLLRDLWEHDWNSPVQARKILQGKADVEILGDIRGTYLAQITLSNPV